jgi:A/G-specific adenine glycosylase
MQQTDSKFIQTVKSYYDGHQRILPWRVLSDDRRQRFYEVLVSEMMLQQTQVSRVVPKYAEWMRAFPTMKHATDARLVDIVEQWQGLGYNRRAKYLHEALKMTEQQGVSDDLQKLTALPGVGVNTAGAIVAYAFDKPAVFIETNIRSVYIHHYFTDHKNITDKQIIEVVERTMDRDSPREWYWALMDYGSYLKQSINNISQSAHYARQSKFEGSSRQLRAGVVKQLINGPQTFHSLNKLFDDDRLQHCLDSLVKDGLIKKTSKSYCISE